MRIDLTPQTCRRPSPLTEVERIVRQLPVLEDLNYLVFATRNLQVLNCDPLARYSDVPLHRQRIGPKGFSAVVSGTFRQLHPNECVLYPAGPVMRRGSLDTEGPGYSRGRGAIAVLKDRTIVAGRCIGTSKKDIQDRFSEPSNPVREFMGGGALLVECGKRIRDVDLEVYQQFLGTPGGYRAPGMRTNNHVVIGIRKGQCFVLVAHDRSARQIAEDLAHQEFGTAVKFERGAGLFLNDGKIRINGRNRVGFGVHIDVPGPLS
jgi:hypothetical protein